MDAIAHITSYAGESLAKKVARVRTYLRAKQMLEASGQTEKPNIVILPGPEGSEIGCLQHILKPKTLFVVDREESCVENFLRKSEDRLSGDDFKELVTTSHVGELSDFNPNQPIHFANLDLMGPLSGELIESGSTTYSWLRHGSIASITYLRGRERKELSTLLMLSDPDQVCSSFSEEDKRRFGPDAVRTVLAFNRLRLAYSSKELLSALGPEDLKSVSEDPSLLYQYASELWDALQDAGIRFTVVGSHAYQGTSPMGILLAQFLTGDEPESYSQALTNFDNEKMVCSRIRKGSLSEFLLEASNLESMGYSNDQVAEIFDISTESLSLLKACRMESKGRIRKKRK